MADNNNEPMQFGMDDLGSFLDAAAAVTGRGAGRAGRRDEDVIAFLGGLTEVSELLSDSAARVNGKFETNQLYFNSRDLATAVRRRESKAGVANLPFFRLTGERERDGSKFLVEVERLKMSTTAELTLKVTPYREMIDAKEVLKYAILGSAVIDRLEAAGRGCALAQSYLLDAEVTDEQ